MAERRPGFNLDRYLRREDTYLAKALRRISPESGRSYRLSEIKRFIELMVAIPSAVIATPLIGVLSLAAKMEDGGRGFYLQERVGEKGRAVRVIKIRTMREGSDENLEEAINNSVNYCPEDDPRNSSLGRILRRYDLEELPQLWQVVQGSLALIEIRVMPQYFIDFLGKEHSKNFNRWQAAYLQGRPGVLSLNAALNYTASKEKNCVHYDLLYAKKTSLGLDFYILWRFGSGVANRVMDRVLKRGR